MSIKSRLKSDMRTEMHKILGPFYHYAENVTNPGEMGVSGSGSVGQLWENVGSISSYVDTITFGNRTISSIFDNVPNQKPLGNKFFVKNGKCGKKSSPECKGMDRYMYINNIPSGKIPCINELGIKLPATGFKGLVPGLMENVANVNPMAIFNSLGGKGVISDNCYLRTEEVGSRGNFRQETRCSTDTPPIQCLPKVFENFENKNRNNFDTNNIYLIILILIIIFIFIYSK